MKEKEIWEDIKGQVVYIKGSHSNKTERLTREEFKYLTEYCPLGSGTVTTKNGTVFYAPFSKRQNNNE